MSEENVQIVRRVYEQWSRGDFSGGDAFHPEVEFEMVDWPGRDRSRGLGEMREAWLASLSAWDDFRAEPTGFLENDPHVVVLTHVTARGKGSGAPTPRRCGRSRPGRWSASRCTGAARMPSKRQG
jgi:ketosteroid isomerase-like protein